MFSLQWDVDSEDGGDVDRIVYSKQWQESENLQDKSEQDLPDVKKDYWKIFCPSGWSGNFLNELHAGFSLYEAKSVVNMHRQEINRILCPSIKI